jgi:transposase-like protein
MTKFTLKDFQKTFSNDDVCLDYIRVMRYPERIDCPKCGKNSLFHHDNGKKSYSCDHCGYQISPTAGTIFHKSPTPLTIWFYAIYVMAQTRGGVSAKAIQRETGVTYKTAWRMCKQIRSMLSEDHNIFSGEVELDESYYGGEEKNKHANKKTAGAQGRSTKTKAPVFGMVERGGNLIAETVENVQSKTIMPIVKESIEKGTQIYTDEFNAYNSLRSMGYQHGVVPHKEKIFVWGKAHTNTIEGFWSLSKNGIRGTYHAVSDKYLQHYLDEFSFRYNHRNDVTPMFLSFLSLAASPLRVQAE